ncbi:MAG: tRNA pseudouridine(55) synthase TruB [Gammaproteobacteria bacterium]|jgi:tRNA pseudouridine55 synthase|nr:tRNA pseudouridine(55) synthase TruB [Gammaproteobacteria bacterium]|tara:strand:+ start:824 stop:1702 length:879 start_codon:yes stop_codon:yes gene_type:complete
MINGLILIDKPRGISSNNTLKQVKKILSVKKAGIVGILDPLATGMLPIVIGEATKFSKYIELFNKSYIVDCKLGYKSSTGDDEGIIEKDNRCIKDFNILELKNNLDSFVGTQEQIPPMHSAIKIDGVRLYKLARQGIEVERKSRSIKILSINFLNYSSNILSFEIMCSKGTYIRTLVEDLGLKLNIFSYTKHLRRTKIGFFEENQMISLEKLKNSINNNSDYLISMDSMLSHMKLLTISDDDELKIRNGQSIYYDSDVQDAEIRMQNNHKDLIGVGFIKNNYISPKRLVNFK